MLGKCFGFRNICFNVCRLSIPSLKIQSAPVSICLECHICVGTQKGSYFGAFQISDFGCSIYIKSCKNRKEEETIFVGEQLLPECFPWNASLKRCSKKKKTKNQKCGSHFVLLCDLLLLKNSTVKFLTSTIVKKSLYT